MTNRTGRNRSGCAFDTLLCSLLATLCIFAMLLNLPLGSSFAHAQDTAPPSADAASPGETDIKEETRDDEVSDTADIAQLIQQLGDDDYYRRQQAYEVLREYAFDAYESLSAATEHEDFEIASSVRRLLRSLEVQWERVSDSGDLRGVFSGYSELSEFERIRRIDLLHGIGNPADAAEGLTRVIRFERSSLLSRLAAVHLIGRMDADAESMAETIRENIRRSPRKTARLVGAWLSVSLADTPDFSTLRPVIDQEIELARNNTTDTQPHLPWLLLIALSRQQHKASRPDLLEATVEDLFGLIDRTNDLELREAMLQDLLDGLLAWEAPSLIDRMGERFLDKQTTTATTVYRFAEYYDQFGMAEKADATAKRASEKPTDIRGRYLLARTLRDRGRIDWAEREFREVIERGKPSPDANDPFGAGGPEDSAVYLDAAQSLSAMLHDQLRDDEAANVLKSALDAAVPTSGGITTVSIEQIFTLTGRMHTFRAEHLLRQGDTKGHQAELIKAISVGSEPDLDAIIATYHLRDLSEEDAKKVRLAMINAFTLEDQPDDAGEVVANAIKTALDLLERQIKQNRANAPDALPARAIPFAPNNPYMTLPLESPSPYNEYAWLAANTLGAEDAALLSKAIEYSKRSIALCQNFGLNPGGYYDTLAHAYAAKDDPQQAVEAQSKAVALLPESKLLRIKLDEFKAQLAKKTGQPVESLPAVNVEDLPTQFQPHKTMHRVREDLIAKNAP